MKGIDKVPNSITANVKMHVLADMEMETYRPMSPTLHTLTFTCALASHIISFQRLRPPLSLTEPPAAPTRSIP